MFDDGEYYCEDCCEDSQYQTHYICNFCGYEFWSDDIENECWNCCSDDIEEID